MDPIDRFEQQFYSEELLRQHGSELAAEARRVLQQNAQLQLQDLAGLILLSDSGEAAKLRALVQHRTKSAVPSGTMAGVVPRAMVADALARHPPESFTKDPDQLAELSRRLPVLVATRDGFRIAFVAVEPDSEPD